jgi:large subunit ribosomal protein L6
MKIENMEERIEVPEGITVSLEGSTIRIKGGKGEVDRAFKDPRVSIAVEGNEVVIRSKDATKREKTRMGSYKAHINNMFKGVTEGHEYLLKICSGHFPMNVSVKGDQFVVNNFLGEKVPRKLKLKQGAKVTINGTEVKVESSSKELAGQVAADIEQLCRITNRDRRICQDGIYIISKDGKKI